MPAGLDLFVLHALSNDLLPVELIRVIVRMCREAVLQRCCKCKQQLMLLKDDALTPTGVRYYILNDECYCEDCSGIKERYERFVAQQEALGVDTNYLCGFNVNQP